MQEITHTSLDLLDKQIISKTNIAAFAHHILTGVAEGYISPLQAAAACSAMENAVKLIRPEIIPYVVEHLEKENGKTEYCGAKIEQVETGVKYDYTHNSKWVELNNKIQKLAAEQKELEDMLKKIPPGQILVHGETGETFYGPAKSSTTSFKITLAK